MGKIEHDSEFLSGAENYLSKLRNIFQPDQLASIELLARDLYDAWVNCHHVYICGNGGSAANALHLANDFHYGIGACGTAPKLPGLRVEALSANQGIITCLANDIGYENIFAHQLEVKARPSDLLIALSGSGNSENIVRALETARKINMKSYAVLAFHGGQRVEKADKVIYFPIKDMQIAEDTQLIVGHLCMQWLNKNKPSELSLKA